MGGNKTGGAKQRESQIKKYGSPEAWKAEMSKRGKKGADAPHPKGRGFSMNIEAARRLGKKGGSAPRGKK